MSKWLDIADWVGPTTNETPGGMEHIVGLVLHIQQGNQQGSIAWCKNPASQVSAHFFVPKVGRPQQLVDTADEAWAQAGGNAHWLSIENEGYSGQDLTAGQIQACATLLARAHHQYGVPLQNADAINSAGLGWHGMGGDQWGGHPDCPGAPVIAQRPVIIAHAELLLGMGGGHIPPIPARPAPPWPGRVFVSPLDPPVIGADVLDWQRRMQLRGWIITADGEYGPQSRTVCLAFQRDSNAHDWDLAEDGEVGPETWRASWERPVSA
ncbi:MAG TPA: N-acetylmuramoyl-L-alanine amidase [Actinocrinis sp.]|uniref:peptidoglycan recognition protein family protein n=1 Tax=Actinocrinis sp. TaxID=1920516 RepID=UPI002DDD8EC1|nr:N-acetylmuramoyl-L-alanine amidase [Actinocrinis sp.]HEV2347601.1 N-acetylmuramoyl-L-alanine amidase [Actinocrinis sp.]